MIVRRRDMQRVNPPAAWRHKASAAQTAVRDGLKTPSELSSVWGELKSELSRLSHGKCWYCESRQTRSDNAVDHFRPKSDYPWLAFSYENYRFACSFCNSPHRSPVTGRSQGKSNFFPLFENSLQAKDQTEIDSKQPILLDPCNATDPGLLDFRSDGTPCPRFADNPIFRRRVEESIRIYHLDHPELVEQRRVLALRLEGWIRVADALYPRVLQGDQVTQQAFAGFVGNIGQALDDQAELSVFARRIVTNHRTKPWIEPILDT
jgi:uncharacterized protein (TIGR02646 family)